MPLHKLPYRYSRANHEEGSVCELKEAGPVATAHCKPRPNSKRKLITISLVADTSSYKCFQEQQPVQSQTTAASAFSSLSTSPNKTLVKTTHWANATYVFAENEEKQDDSTQTVVRSELDSPVADDDALNRLHD